MRTFIIILVIVAVIGFFGYRYSSKAIDNINFNPKFVGADLKSIFSKTGFANIDMQATITNKNNFNIPVNNLYIEVYYNGAIVGKSTVPHEKFIVPANGSITISQNISLAVTNSLAIAGKLIAGQKVEFEYMIKGQLFNFLPLKVKGTFTY
jgi:LEA14-like dessication related protein